ncbi:hypothetical protein T265_07681 [Opisthorchis viverrini]|uniref:Uncharacterized protein n=1 Tax=Opisthorchis viverrini TaxID=6198 RepID=A0A075AAY3_OPIVI|nr:hypothetical protein T265_07681 [Opisthorchis viverrini]KER24729.1 hypothetical protein T265_07681 [Opisthorchis viverrini]
MRLKSTALAGKNMIINQVQIKKSLNYSFQDNKTTFRTELVDIECAVHHHRSTPDRRGMEQLTQGGYKACTTVKHRRAITDSDVINDGSMTSEDNKGVQI